MNANRIQRVLQLCLFGLLTTSGEAADEAILGFTEPVRQIRLAAADTGLLRTLEVEAGDEIVEGEILGSLDSSVLQANARIAQSRIDGEAKTRAAAIRLKQAESNYVRLNELTKEGHGGVRELEIASSELELAQTEVQAVEEDKELARMELKRIEAELKRRQIIAPIKGIVAEVHHDVGEYVSLTDPVIATVVDLSELRIRFNPTTPFVSKLREDQLVAVRMTHSSKVVAGRIDFISPVSNATSATTRIDVLLDNQNGRIRSGQKCVLLPDYDLSRLTGRIGISKPRFLQ